MNEHESAEHPGWTYRKVIFWPDSGACEGWAWDGPEGECVADLGDWEEPPEWPYEEDGALREDWRTWSDF